MNSKDRLAIVASLQQQEIEMIDTKGREYTGGAALGNENDTLSNFKLVGERTGLHPLQAWSVYFLKHIDSIMTYVRDVAEAERDGRAIRELSEPINGRIVDARTYLGLLQCLIDDPQEPRPTHSQDDYLLEPIEF